MRETWIQSPGWEDPLGEGMAIYSSILAWRIPMNKGAWQATAQHIDTKDLCYGLLDRPEPGDRSQQKEGEEKNDAGDSSL